MRLLPHPEPGREASRTVIVETRAMTRCRPRSSNARCMTRCAASVAYPLPPKAGLKTYRSPRRDAEPNATSGLRRLSARPMHGVRHRE
jgi:hypothetical protein